MIKEIQKIGKGNKLQREASFTTGKFHVQNTLMQTMKTRSVHNSRKKNMSGFQENTSTT